MANVIIEEQNLVNIANAIRNNYATTDRYKPSEMAPAINTQAGDIKTSLTNLSTPSTQDPTTNDYITQLETDKTTLKNNLTTKGVTGLTNNMTFTELAPKVLETTNIEDYFTPTISYVGASSDLAWKNTLYKFPPLRLSGTSCHSLFYNSPFIKIDVSKFNTSNITTFQQMFRGCSKLTEIIGIENFNLNGMTASISDMFKDCSSLTSLNLNNWSNTQKIISNSRGVFSGCTNLTTLNINNWNISNCTSFQAWFSGCTSLTNLDLSNWSNTICTNHAYMFSNCTSLQTLDVRNMNFSQSQNYTTMLDNVPTTCLIIVKDQTEKNWFNTNFSSYTNVKLSSEL